MYFSSRTLHAHYMIEEYTTKKHEGKTAHPFDTLRMSRLVEKLSDTGEVSKIPELEQNSTRVL